MQRNLLAYVASLTTVLKIRRSHADETYSECKLPEKEQHPSHPSSEGPQYFTALHSNPREIFAPKQSNSLLLLGTVLVWYMGLSFRVCTPAVAVTRGSHSTYWIFLLNLIENITGGAGTTKSRLKQTHKTASLTGSTTRGSPSWSIQYLYSTFCLLALGLWCKRGARNLSFDFTVTSS